MRIVHVVPTYLPATRYGGPIHSVHGLCSALAAAGHEVHVYTTSADGEGDSEVPLGRPVELDGVRVWYFQTAPSRRPGEIGRALTPRVGRRLYYAPKLAAALQERVHAADLVHLHSVFLWPTSRAARLAHAAGVPYVVSPRGMLVRELIEARSTAVKMAWLGAVESTTLAQARAVCFTSRLELADAGALPLPLPAPFVVPNGVDLAAAEAARVARGASQGTGDAARDGGGRHALYLGRLSWKKNLERAIEALVGTDVRLTLCGPDDEGLTPRLLEHAGRLGVRERVEIVAPVHGAEKWARLSAAELVVLPSLHESFGNTVPEAMACGTPVVVSRGVGAAELVIEAGAGEVCEPSAQGLRAALSALWNDPGRRQRAAGAGRVYAAARLGWGRVAAEMAGHYRKLCGPERRRATGQNRP